MFILSLYSLVSMTASHKHGVPLTRAKSALCFARPRDFARASGSSEQLEMYLALVRY